MTREESQQLRRKRQGQRRLLLITGLFFVPVVIAYLLYFMLPHWLPKGTNNNGTLVQPARPLFEYSHRPVPVNMPRAEGDIPVPRRVLKQTRLVDPDGNRFSPSIFRGKWTFVQIARGKCDSACRKRLYDTRQIRIAAGKDMGRVRRVLIVLSPKHWKGLQAEAKRHDPRLMLLRATRSGAAPLLRFFSSAVSGAAVADSHVVYLLDPLGNWFMYYRPGVKAKGIQKDLHHLMRISEID